MQCRKLRNSMRDTKSADPRARVLALGLRLRPVPEGDPRRSTAEVVVYAYTSEPIEQARRVRRALARTLALQKKARLADADCCQAETFLLTK